ncbi:hypothetical protein [Brevibacterium aurantiacum]|uniref:Uncharacterized protein n=1 Tax=Brevibacterium aurantiacum TaxID=273384 RepID=A0A556CBY9_BREAU|nr:hypothetical protein [Brevibacterium aurantiacum]TSI14558.1 hypothetical protein FO013_14420 [Brevibacterium aurantiacum]
MAAEFSTQLVGDGGSVSVGIDPLQTLSEGGPVFGDESESEFDEDANAAGLRRGIDEYHKDKVEGCLLFEVEAKLVVGGVDDEQV